MSLAPSALRSALLRASLAGFILIAEFAILEVAFRLMSGSEAAPAFQSLFMQDPRVGHRLQPNARARYTTDEFSTDVVINGQGVRDDQEIGPKAPNERRIVILGDSLVLSVQVPFEQTFGHLLEERLNAANTGVRWRVINAGVQGYGVVDEYLLFKHVVSNLEPDLVLVAAFPGNAVSAYDKRDWLQNDGPVRSSVDTHVNNFRRILRSSMVWQNARLRYDQLKSRMEGPTTERPLLAFLKQPPPEIDEGLSVVRQATGRIDEIARAKGARTAVILMTARFQTDDGDWGRLQELVRVAGSELDRDAANERYKRALEPLHLPLLDLLPILRAQPDRGGLFYQRNVHFTPRGHVVAAQAIYDFMMTSGLATDVARSAAVPPARPR